MRKDAREYKFEIFIILAVSLPITILNSFFCLIAENLIIRYQLRYFYLVELSRKGSMQGQYNGSPILRNSYGFQIQQQTHLRSPNSKGFPMPMPNNQHFHHANETISTTIKQMQNKIEGMQNLVKRKQHQPQIPEQVPNAIKYASNTENRLKPPLAVNQLQEPLNEAQLRGSCQNIIKKFDYNNLRNTTHFNQMAKFPQNEIRKTPYQESNGYKNGFINRTMAQEPANNFLRPNQKLLINNKHSFVNNANLQSQKPFEQKTVTSSKTPTKYKSLFDNPSTKTSLTMKSISETEEKKKYTSLNEIIDTKNMERKNTQGSKLFGKRSKIINGFEFGQVLGKGKFGEVFLARHHETGFIAAIKRIQKSKVKQYKMIDQFVKQIRLHSCLDHPNIVKFFGVFEQQEFIYLVMEYMNGGTLFDCLNEVSVINVKDAAQYLKDIIEALTYMHDKSIAHRDIKPENIVISSEGVAKLCDFGWSAVVQTSRKTYCGTFDYAPPEILQRKNYDTSVDIWCIGVLAYELLTGRVPFEGEKRNIIMDKIVNVDKNKIDYPVDIPPEAKEFIQCLIQKDPNLRPKCQDLLKFRLFTLHLPKGAKSKKIQ